MSIPTRDDGGPAFPRPRTAFGYSESIQYEQDGMTLRDWFAGQALETVCLLQDVDPSARLTPAYCAQRAYDVADAMIAERAK